MARGLLKRGHAEPDKFRLRRVYREEFLAVFWWGDQCAALSRPHFLTYAIQLDCFVAALLAMTAC